MAAALLCLIVEIQEARALRYRNATLLHVSFSARPPKRGNGDAAEPDIAKLDRNLQFMATSA